MFEESTVFDVAASTFYRFQFIIIIMTLLRLFAAPKGGIEKLKPLQEQEGPNSSSFNDLEIMSSREIALQVFDDFSVF